MAQKPANPILVLIMVLSAIWLLAMVISIWRTNVERSGLKALVLLGVAGLFLGGWALAYLSWSRRQAKRS